MRVRYTGRTERLQSRAQERHSGPDVRVPLVPDDRSKSTIPARCSAERALQFEHKDDINRAFLFIQSPVERGIACLAKATEHRIRRDNRWNRDPFSTTTAFSACFLPKKHCAAA